jgi:glycosyltransferase involved in cell wall biosynthesis
MSLINLLSKDVYEDIAIIDSRFPRPVPFGFRNTEINNLFNLLPSINSYTMYPMKPGQEAWFNHGYGIERVEFEANKKGYLDYYPENKKRVKYLNPKKNYHIKLAYSFFLAETYTLLPFYEKHKINFVFVLFPGGAFGLNNQGSDDMLKAIFASKYFKKVIVTKNITHDYLISKKLCPSKKIAQLRGFVQYNTQDQLIEKRLYKKDKKTFDICFVAAKYSQQGIDKGYDVFIEVAKKLAKQHKDIRFHVIGGFDEKDIDVSDIKNKITFYGFKRPDFLRDFYAGMDILLSPNRHGKLYEGNFDGFPLGADAGYMGVALFVTDELNQNIYYNKDEIVIINHNADDITKKISYYYKNTDELYELSQKCQKATMRAFDVETQCIERVNLFKSILKEGL